MSCTERSDITLKRKWIEIAADCHLITTKSKITCDELKHTINSGVFRSDWLRLWYKEVGLELLSDDAAKLLIESETHRQFNELEETIENSSAYLELSHIAFQHNLQDLFEKCLRKTWDFVLGYGHHKDPTIFGVLKAVEYLSSVDPNSALTILERISPIVFNISKFTDGDETRHSKHSISSLAARLNPQTAASIYDQELSDGEWYYAEETILRLLERCDFSSPITKHLYLTGLHSSCYQILREKLENGHPEAKKITANVESLLGINVQSQAEKKHSKTDEFDEKITLQPSDYPPENFEELSAYLKGTISTRKFWKTWYTYWCEQGRELDLVEQLIPHVSKIDSYDDKRYLLDLLFFSQRKLSGKSKAFNLLVAAHNAMNGWSDWYESEENSINRLKKVAEQYPKNIDDFVRLTTSQPDSWKDKFGNLIIPNDKLVFLLSHSGRIKEALQLTLKMVEGLEDSVRNLRLAKPAWDWRQDDSIEEALTKSLVSRLKLPIPSVKLWVIEQLSLLLIDGYPKIEALIKGDLANRKQESECVEVLCVFYIAKSNGYLCPNDLGCYIKARSILSDLLLSKLISNPVEFGTYAHPFTPHIQLDGDSNRFRYFQGNHVPHLYNSRLEKEEQRTGLPLTWYYQAEWDNTFKYQPSAKTTSVDYFFSDNRQRTTGQFYTQASHRGRSAYLRTIEVAKQFYGMPDSYAEHLSILALPIEPAYIGFNPQKPTWLPEWEVEKLLNRDNLIQFVEQALANCVKADNSIDLLALSLPIKLDDNNWVDLTVVKSTNDSNLTNIQIEERSCCISVGSLLDKNLSYEHSNNKQSGDTVLAGTPYPFNRYGHWYSDLETRGLYLPKCFIDGRNIIGSTSDGVYCYYIDNIKIGFSYFWYNEWQPIHPKELRSLCGTFTAVEKDKYSMWYKNEDMIKCLYICRAKILRSKDSYREFDIENHDFSITIEG